jgi:hypothetical protein
MIWRIPQGMRTNRRIPVAAVLALSIFGCDHSDGVDRAMEQQMKELNVTQGAVAKFAGTVTIDGKSPVEAFPKQTLVVLLYDPKNPTAKTPLHANCFPNGNFEFHTYSRDDGVATGSYVVLFAALKRPLMPVGKASQTYQGPDGLLNRYNDPDKNVQDPRFKIDLAEPGKTDWAFELEVQGKDPVTTPGPKAITRLQ